jgi:hypothetical protein
MMPTQRNPGPLSPTPPGSSRDAAGTIPIEPPVYRWYHKLSAVVLIALCVEIGMFLLMFPWTGYWEHNYFSSVLPEWRRHWMNLYFRGAVSGLGVANLLLALGEIFRLRRFARKS